MAVFPYFDKTGIDMKKGMSEYRPDPYKRHRVKQVLSDFQIGHSIMNKPFNEFNGRSIIQEKNRNEKKFNSYKPPRANDPDFSWRANTVRPVTRNKVMGIAAHVASTMVVPKVFARNEKDEDEDQAAIVMGDLMEWVMEQSKYPRAFISAILQGLVNPVMYLHADYVEKMRTERKIDEEGNIIISKVRDEEMSGFKASVIPIDEIYIANAYEPYIQNQDFLIRARKISYKDAEGLYGSHPDFEYVHPGIRNVYVDGEATFYEQYDRDLTGLVEEVTYWNRKDDLKLVLVNGVLVTNPDNPNPRKDKKYPIAKSGHEMISERFFFYKSAVNKMANDQEMVDRLYNMIMDGTFLSLMPPMIHNGPENINSSVVVPGSVTSLQQDSAMQPLNIRSNLRSGMDTLSTVEGSISESSQDSFRQGQMQGPAGRTAFEMSRLEQNARIRLGIFGRMIGFLVEDFGELMLGDIIQHMTVAEADSILSKNGEFKFRKFVLHDKIENGKRMPHEIEFDLSAGTNPRREGLDLMKREGGLDPKKRIFRVNPELAQKLRYMLKVSPDTLQTRSKALDRALNLELYDRAIQNPHIDTRLATQDFLLESYKEGESSKYMTKENMSPEQQAMSQGQEMSQGQGQQMPQGQSGVNQNMTGQLTGSNSLLNTMIADGDEDLM